MSLGYRWYDNGWLVLLAVVTLIVAVFAAIGFAVYYAEKYECAGWERATGRDTVFIKTTPVSWDCFTPSGDGKLIPIDRVRELD